MKHILSIIFLFACSIADAQLVVNELSQGSGNDEYVEFLVTGTRTCKDSCADLRGWILDDNNGWHAQGSGVGIAPGCVRLRNIAQWSCVKFGTIILLYNSGSKNPTITQANDPTDSNNDNVYVIPFNNSSVIDRDSINPNSSNDSYAVFTVTAATPITGWAGVVGMRNGGDAFHTVNPANILAPYHAVGWGDNTQQLNVYFGGSAAGKVHAMKNLTSSDPFLQANWDTTTVSNPGTQTPGLGNNAANTAWINSLKNQVKPLPFYDSTVVTICQGKFHNTPSGPKTIANIYRDTLQTVSGCDSVIITNLKVTPALISSLNISGCDSAFYKSVKYTSSSTFVDTFRTLSGCDSLYLNVNISLTSTLPSYTSICIIQGDSVFLENAFRKTAGTYLDSIPNGACYNKVYSNLQVINPTVNTQNIPAACNSLFYSGQTYNSSTTLRDTVKSALGCDSIYNITNIVIKYDALPSIKSACINPGQSYFVGGAFQTTGGYYYDTLSAPNGCDSIIATNLTIATPVVINNTQSGCTQVTFNGTTYTSNTVVHDTVRTNLGCDSLYTNTTITVNTNSTTTNKSVCIYQGQNYFAGGANQTSSGIYSDTYNLPSGCDSTVITDLRVISPATIVDTLNGCNQVVFNGINYTSNAFVSDTLKTSLGCDSIYRYTTITVSNNSSTSLKDACINQGQSYFAAGTFQTTQGNYTDTYPLPSGCDSTVITRLKVLTPIVLANPINGCNSVVFRGITFTASATVIDTAESVLGCDTIYTLNQITVFYSPSPTENNVCINDGQSYFAGGANQTVSGSYQDTYTAANSCDSIVITNLNVIKPATATVTLDFCDVGFYKGNSYTASTVLPDVLKSFQGCDSVYLNVAVNIHPTISYKITASKPMPIEEGESVELNSNFTATSPYYVWYPSTFVVSGSNLAAVTVAPTVDTKYTMDYFATDSFCKNIDTFTVSVVKKTIPDPVFVMPTAFSPNGDGMNDEFKPLFQDGLELTEFRIYNRWGEMVFEEKGSSFGWDGDYKGVKQPLGVYTYFISVRNIATSKLTNRSGNVTLLR